LNWCNVEAPKELRTDGIDLNSYIQKGKIQSRSLFWMSGFDDEYAVRKGRYKLVHAGLVKGKTFLFNIEKDPGEREDISANEPEIKAQLQAEYDEWVKSRQETRWEDMHVIKSKERTDAWNTRRERAANGELKNTN
jgi:arylsulfatase A-like enzyme